MNERTERPTFAGHAVLVIGYNDTRFIRSTLLESRKYLGKWTWRRWLFSKWHKRSRATIGLFGSLLDAGMILSSHWNNPIIEPFLLQVWSWITLLVEALAYGIFFVWNGIPVHKKHNTGSKSHLYKRRKSIRDMEYFQRSINIFYIYKRSINDT